MMPQTMRKVDKSGKAVVHNGGSVSKNGFCQFVKQQTRVVGNSGEAVGTSIMGMLPHNVPQAVRQQVQDAIEDFVMRVITAMASMKAIGTAVITGTGINQVTRNADEYLLVTQNGKIIPLQDCKMVRLFLMYVGNCNRSLTVEQIRQAEQVGHRKLPPECKNGNWQDVEEDNEEDGGEDNRRHEFDEPETFSRKRGVSANEGSREKTEVLERALHLGISQANRDLKKAIATGDQCAVECLRKGKAALRETLDESIKARYGHTGPEMSEAEKKERRRIQMAVAHVVALVAKKDEELAKHLDIYMVRNGRYGYMPGPRFHWDVCENLIESTKRENTVARVEKQVSLSVPV